MKRRFMKIICLSLATFSVFAQAPAPSSPAAFCQATNCYTASTGSVSLSGAGLAATIQQPSAAPYQQVFGLKATVQCSVACVVTRTKGGTPASATAGSVVQSVATPNGVVAPLLLFFTASNASGGTTIDTYSIPAAGEKDFDLSDVSFGSIPNETYTISVASITGTANITFYVGLR